MALDKQRILSELGSVVNQLQSADCGCMGKMFSNPNQGSSMGTPMQSYGGCRMGCCHGHGAPFAGEPYPHMNNRCMNRSMMGSCNPQKLYADTYSYLNKNLMEPVMNEVYNDLKSISPENTIPISNAMASKLGLPINPVMAGQGNMSGNPKAGGNMTNPNQSGDMGGMSSGYNLGMGNSNASPQMGQQHQYMGQMGQPMGQTGQPMGQMGQPMGQSGQPMGQMGSGMGSQILKMMMSDKPEKPANMPTQNGQLTDSMQSPHGAVDVTPLGQGTYYDANAAMHKPNYALGDAGAYGNNFTGQHMSQPNAYTANSLMNNTPQSNIFQNNLQQNNLPLNNMVHNNMNPNSGDMVQNVSGVHPMAENKYGKHAQGMQKFSEMFPAVMKGDLGFDPMAIAIQMNPANQQQAAMNTMHKLMNGNKVMNMAGDNSVLQPTTNSANGAYASITQSGNEHIIQQNGAPLTNQQMMSNQQPVQSQLQPVQQQQMLQQIDPNAAVSYNQVPPQQVYTAASSGQYQQDPAQQYQQQPQQYQSQAQLQQIEDPNTGAVIDPPTLAGGYELNPNGQIQQGGPYTEAAPLKQMIMEPIFPADTSKNPTYSHQVKQTKNYHYNTLGQPVHMLDAKAYRYVEPPLPQTLSPQPVKPRSSPQTYSNVKNTVSKTSIMGNGPVGRTPSRSQLQHLYNQYSGSHSYTQQNINAPVKYQTLSEGKLHENVNAKATTRPVPVERFGGDTIANNAVVNQEVNKLGQQSAPMGDVAPANKPEGEGATMKVEPMKKGRNGLQDMVYTSAPTTTAWTIHGFNRLPYSAGHRFRTRGR